MNECNCSFISLTLFIFCNFISHHVTLHLTSPTLFFYLNCDLTDLSWCNFTVQYISQLWFDISLLLFYISQCDYKSCSLTFYFVNATLFLIFAKQYIFFWLLNSRCDIIFRNCNFLLIVTIFHNVTKAHFAIYMTKCCYFL